MCLKGNRRHGCEFIPKISRHFYSTQMTNQQASHRAEIQTYAPCPFRKRAKKVGTHEPMVIFSSMTFFYPWNNVTFNFFLLPPLTLAFVWERNINILSTGQFMNEQKSAKETVSVPVTRWLLDRSSGVGLRQDLHWVLSFLTLVCYMIEYNVHCSSTKRNDLEQKQIAIPFLYLFLADISLDNG